MRKDIWLCRVLVHAPQVKQMTLDALQPYYARVVAGELACLNDDSIVEPVEQFASEELAHDGRGRKLVDEPKTDWRVVVVYALDNGERA